MKRALFIIVGLMLMSIPALAQMTGTVDGTVADAEGNLLGDARVVLMNGDRDGGMGGGGMGGGGMMDNLVVWTDDAGAFLFEDVEIGDYLIRAMMMGLGMDQVEITVAANETTVIDLVLAMDGNGGGDRDGGHGMRDWEEVTLHGWVILEENDFHNFYFLDEDNDGVAEYLLGFGPPDYEPASGAVRPLDGDEIDITGGLMTRGDWDHDLPMVMVFTLNDLVWFTRDDDGHHNGHGGGWHDDHGCNFEEPVLTDAAGWAIVGANDGMHEQYWMSADDDEEADFRLGFGAPDYAPDNGAERPVDGDWVEIVGGLIEGCPTLPTLVVYEINGLFWREPGDTTGFGPYATTAVSQETTNLVPSEHLIVEAYPDPFNPSTKISVIAPASGHSSIAVFDLLGREMLELHNGDLNAGIHNFTLDAGTWAAGIYFVRVQSGSEQAIQRIHLLK